VPLLTNRVSALKACIFPLFFIFFFGPKEEFYPPPPPWLRYWTAVIWMKLKGKSGDSSSVTSSYNNNKWQINQPHLKFY